MKKFSFLTVIAAIFLFSDCKPKPTAQASLNDTTAITQVSDTIPSPLTESIFIPQPTDYVNDLVNIFTAPQVKVLDSLIRNYEKKGIAQISIITLDTVLVNHQNFEYYTLRIANAWGMGQEGKGNGILVAIAPGLRRMRIQNGVAIEKIFSNEETKKLIDSVFIPNFKKGDYFEGTKQGLTALMNKLEAK